MFRVSIVSILVVLAFSLMNASCVNNPFGGKDVEEIIKEVKPHTGDVISVQPYEEDGKEYYIVEGKRGRAIVDKKGNIIRFLRYE